MQDFKRLLVWQKAHTLFLAANEVFTPQRTRAVPWLRSQVLRAAASIPANIAEGCAKSTSREFSRFIDIATASSHELENHLIAARDVRVISTNEFRRLEALVIEVRRMLIGLAKAIRRQPKKQESTA
jgi:four helix bundle protein